MGLQNGFRSLQVIWTVDIERDTESLGPNRGTLLNEEAEEFAKRSKGFAPSERPYISQYEIDTRRCVPFLRSRCPHSLDLPLRRAIHPEGRVVMYHSP